MNFSQTEFLPLPRYRIKLNHLFLFTGQAAGSTSCGVLLKVLVKTPVFVDGSHVVLLTPLPGGAASNAARSLFGSTGGLASLRSKFC